MRLDDHGWDSRRAEEVHALRRRARQSNPKARVRLDGRGRRSRDRCRKRKPASRSLAPTARPSRSREAKARPSSLQSTANPCVGVSPADALVTEGSGEGLAPRIGVQTDDDVSAPGLGSGDARLVPREARRSREPHFEAPGGREHESQVRRDAQGVVARLTETAMVSLVAWRTMACVHEDAHLSRRRFGQGQDPHCVGGAGPRREATTERSPARATPRAWCRGRRVGASESRSAARRCLKPEEHEKFHRPGRGEAPSTRCHGWSPQG